MSISEPHLVMTDKHNTTPDLPVSVKAQVYDDLGKYNDF